MCGRFSLRTPTDELVRFFVGIRFPNLSARYNIAPTQRVLCLRDDQAVELRWGLVPSWAKDAKIGANMINARAETVAEKPAFRAALKRRRCLVLADGFYEWKNESQGKQPYYICSTDADNPILCFAGLWESWNPSQRETDQPSLFDAPISEDDSDITSPLETCTIITTTANTTISNLHHRMPVILDQRGQQKWLDPNLDDAIQLKELLTPCREDRLRFYPVDKRVNRANFNDASCIEPI